MNRLMRVGITLENLCHIRVGVVFLFQSITLLIFYKNEEKFVT